MQNLFAKLALVAIFLSAPFALQAQDNAAMTGVVTDASGAVVPGTDVTLSNPLTGAKFTQTTDKKGSYRFANVPPGAGYKANFTHDGFSAAEFSNITLSVAITRTQDAKLVVGSNETVEVSAAGSNVTLDTSDASIGNNIDPQELQSLPVYDRTSGITTLFALQPGVDSTTGAVTGARIDQSEVTLDGMDVNEIAAGFTFQIVGNAPVDSVDQFTGTVAGLIPSVGTGSGGQFQLVTKSGTNQFHGNLNEYHRDTTTEANTYFNNLVGNPRTPLIRNQFGGSIGGPVIIPKLYNGKDKLFFFFNYGGSRIIESASTERTVPLANLHGPNPTLNYINTSSDDCGDSTRLNPATQTSPCVTALSIAQVKGFDPQGKGFNPAILSLINSRYPLPNDFSAGDGINTGGYVFSYPANQFENTYVGRVDYNITPTQKIFGRFNIDRENGFNDFPEFPKDPVTHPQMTSSYSYVVSHVWTIGQNKVNQFYYGDTIEKFNTPDTFNPPGADQFTISGFDGPYTAVDGQKRRIPNPEVRDDFNWQIGSHNLTFGGTFKFPKTTSEHINDFNLPVIGLGGGIAGGLGDNTGFRPDDISTGDTELTDYDSLFASTLGVIGDVSRNYTYTSSGAANPPGTGSDRTYRYYQTEAYLGDTWKVNSKLTLSYGVRYQFYSVPYETHGLQSALAPGSPDFDTYIKDRLAQGAAHDTSNGGLPFYTFVLGGKANNGPPMYAPNYKDFAPRFAFAYNPSPKTVINGSAGIVYDRTVISSVLFLQDQVNPLFGNNADNGLSTDGTDALLNNPRVGTNLSYPASTIPASSAITLPFTPNVDGGVPFGLSNGAETFFIQPKLKDPYSIALNFGIQQEFPGHIIMKLNYSGRLGRRLLATADAAQVIDYSDKVSGQSLSSAFGSVTTQVRAGGDPESDAGLTAQPWFENVLRPNVGVHNGYANNTSLAADVAAAYPTRGDLSDWLYILARDGLLPTNVGIPAQFGTIGALTNKGSSTYNGLLLTVDKNVSQGLTFGFNYTWSHSIDNTSLSANNNAFYTDTGFICDDLHPRACRGNSDFDVTQEITADFVYDLPFGHGRTFQAAAPQWLDEAIGGWSFSGLPSYRTGLAMNVYADAFLSSFSNYDPAIFTGNKNDLSSHINKTSDGTVHLFGGGAAGATKALSDFRGPIGIEYGQRNYFRGPGAFYFDAGLGKTFPIIQNKLNLKFRADAFDLFNHPVFNTPGTTGASGAQSSSLNIVTSASNFGSINTTDLNAVGGHSARVAQFSLRLEF
jgi:hypothetical protein